MSDNVIYVDFSKKKFRPVDFIVYDAMEDLQIDVPTFSKHRLQKIKDYANHLHGLQIDDCDIYDTIAVILRPEFSKHYDEVINIFAQNFN